MQWPLETIRELIERASEKGESEAELSSPKEAEHFRYAVKNYKRRYGVGENLTTKIVGNNVVVLRKVEVKLKEPLHEQTSPLKTEMRCTPVQIVNSLKGSPPSLVVFFWLEGESLHAATPRLANGRLIQIELPRAIDPEYETSFEKMVRAELYKQQPRQQKRNSVVTLTRSVAEILGQEEV